MAFAQLLIIHEQIMRKRYDEWLCLLRINNLVHLVARMIYWVSTFDLSIWFVFSLFFLFLMCFFFILPAPAHLFFLSVYSSSIVTHTQVRARLCWPSTKGFKGQSLYHANHSLSLSFNSFSLFSFGSSWSRICSVQLSLFALSISECPRF